MYPPGWPDYGSGFVLFPSFYLLDRIWLAEFYWAYRHGLQNTVAGASLSIQRLIARSGYSGQLWILQAGGKNDGRFS